jgi:predicted MFS family arabinose efflux permease
MTANLSVNERRVSKRFFLPSLVIAVFSAGISNSILTLFVVDIARTFFGSANPTAVGTISQLSTLNAAAEIVFAFLLSILIIRIRSKPLLIVGMSLLVISALGSYVASDLFSLQIFLALEGGGSIIASIMAFTLIGNYLPAQKKAQAISYVVSAGSIATLILILMIGLVGNFDWRYDFLLFSFPISMVGLAISAFALPSNSLKNPFSDRENLCLKSFKEILKNRSATACLVANILTVAGTQVAIFAIAFYRVVFKVTGIWTAMIYETAVIIFIISPLVSGLFVKKFGAKPIAVVCSLLAALFTMVFFFIPNLWLTVVFDMLHVGFAAMAAPAFVYLVLEQVPEFRGTMMSLNTIFNNVGNVIAPAAGGALLAFTNGIYGAAGLALGCLTIIGVAVLLFFVKDLTKT